MSRQSSGRLSAALFALLFAGLFAGATHAEDAGQSALMEKGMEKAASAAPTGPSAITDIKGIFRVRGLIRKKTSGLTTCSCYVYFYHDNLQGGDYYTYGNKSFSGKKCNMNLPFRFPLGDTGRPVVVQMSASCSGDSVYRYYSADLQDIPLNSGNSKIVTFDIDM